MTSTEPNDTTTTPPPEPQHHEYTGSSKGRFRFKPCKQGAGEKTAREHSGRHHRSKRHKTSDRHHRKRHKTTHADDAQDGPSGKLSPQTAFRESLFDALGDDEGAAYWESVYGQPIHTYSVPNVAKGPQGELEQMDEEEYAAYVRARMWERTREGMEAERERVRRERVREKERERRGFERAMEESLRRGRERRRKRAWGGTWAGYLRCWDVVDEVAGRVKGGRGEKRPLRNLVFWPVESGKRADVSREAVEEFMRHAPAPAADGEHAAGDAPQDLLVTLKAERVRWHPDKIQHRYGVLGIDDVVMQSVTEVFQIVDTMWNELREKAG